MRSKVVTGNRGRRLMARRGGAHEDDGLDIRGGDV
jgi:hypothetical protein